MTTATMEVYDKEEMLQAINDWFGLSDYETVMKQLETETRCRNFGDYTQVPVIKENKSLISIKEFLKKTIIMREKNYQSKRSKNCWDLMANGR